MANGDSAAVRFAPKLPPSVQAQADKAKALQTSLAQGQPVPGAEPVKTAPPQAQPAPQATPSPTPQGVTPAPAPSQPQGDDWQAKYNVLQGKYNAEMRQYQTALAEANATITHLNGFVQNLSSRVSELEQAGGAATPPAQHQGQPPGSEFKTLNPDDFEGYGDEMVDMVKLVNAQAEYIRGLENRIAGMGERVETTSRETFYTTLDGLVPNWEAANADPGFVAWLQNPDPLAGVKRHDLLRQAFEDLDAQRVARFFLAWKQETGIQGDFQPSGTAPSAQPATTAGAPTPQQAPVTAGSPYQVAQPVVPFEQGMGAQVMPQGVAGNQGPIQSETPLVTRAQYQKAVQDFIQKRITQEEYNQIATNFQKCIAEGKVA